MTFASAPEAGLPPSDEEPSASEPPKTRYFFLSEDRTTATPRPAGESVDDTTRAARAQVLRQRGGRIIVAMQDDKGRFVDLAYASTDGWRGPSHKSREPHRVLPRLPKIRRISSTRSD